MMLFTQATRGRRGQMGRNDGCSAVNSAKLAGSPITVSNYDRCKLATSSHIDSDAETPFNRGLQPVQSAGAHRKLRALRGASRFFIV
jgi:hypothetical protein